MTPGPTYRSAIASVSWSSPSGYSRAGAVLRQSVKRPKLRIRDRVFWVWLSRLWPKWQSVPILVQVRNGHQVASNRIQAALDAKIEGRQIRMPTHPTGAPCPDPTLTFCLALLVKPPNSDYTY